MTTPGSDCTAVCQRGAAAVQQYRRYCSFAADLQIARHREAPYRAIKPAALCSHASGRAGYPLGEHGVVRGRILLLLPGEPLFDGLPGPKICSTVEEVQAALHGAMARVSGDGLAPAPARPRPTVRWFILA